MFSLVVSDVFLAIRGCSCLFLDKLAVPAALPDDAQIVFAAHHVAAPQRGATVPGGQCFGFGVVAASILARLRSQSLVLMEDSVASSASLTARFVMIESRDYR